MNDNWYATLGKSIEDGIFGKLLLLFKYGSCNKNTDNDYFAIYNSLAQPPNIILGGLDLWAIGRKELFLLIDNVDPFVTEPMLTGSIVTSSDEELISDINKTILQVKPTKQSISYLVKRSYDSLEFAKYVKNVEDDSKIKNRKYWSALSFSITYWLFAKEYTNNWVKVMTVSELIDSLKPEIKSFLNLVNFNKREYRAIDGKFIEEWINLTLLEK